METDKNSRLLYLYEMLVHGEGLQKKKPLLALVSTSAASRGTSTACVIFCQSGAAAGDPIQGEGAAV